MSIVNDTNAIGPILTQLEAARKNRFKPKTLDYDATANAGEFVWNMIQTGEAVNATVWPAVAQDDRITRNDLKTDIDMFSFVRWLHNQPQSGIEIIALYKITHVEADGVNSGLSNIKTFLCRLRMLQLL